MITEYQPAITLEDRQHDFRLVVNVLSYVMLLVGVITMCFSAFVTIRSYSPVWYQDQWTLGFYLTANGGHYPLHLLWDQHNEHRTPILQLLCLADLYFFAGRSVLLYAANWISQLAQFGLSILVVKQLGSLSSAQFRSIVGLIAFCEFNPNQLENFTWAYQSAFFLASFFTALSIALLVFYARSKAKPGSPQLIALFFASIFSAFLAECNLASGLIVWVILPFCSVMLGLSKRILRSLVVAGTMGVAVYLVGYQTPSYHTKPIEALKKPAQVFTYVETYFATSWDLLGRNLGLVVSLFAIGFLLIISVQMVIRTKRKSFLTIFSVTFALVCLLTAVMTALGRLKFGIDQATSSRYQTPAMLFWCFTATAFISILDRFDYKQLGVLLVQVVALSLFVFQVRTYPGILNAYSGLRFTKDVAGLALEARTDPDMVKMLFPDLNVVQWFRFMADRNILPPPFPEFQYVGLPLRTMFEITPASSCRGYFDQLNVAPGESSGRLRAQGWASIQSPILGRSTIILTTEDNRIAGVGVTGAPRPDVVSAGLLPDNEVDSGWLAYAVVNRSSQKLRAYEELPDGRHVCPLLGEQQIPR
jgi:hypothetical protein